MGTQTYVYKGQEYVLSDKYSQDEAIAKIKSIAEPQQVQEQPEDSGVVSDFMKGVKGTAALAGDIASGMVKLPVQAAATVIGKAARPDLNLNELWNAAGQSIEGYSPSFGSTIGPNAAYEAGMKPLELYGKAVDTAAEKLSMGNKDVEGALRIAGNFVPIPFAGKVGRFAGTALEHIDPGLRRAGEVVKQDPVANLDRVTQQEGLQVSPDVPRMTQEQADAYYAQRNAQRPTGPSPTEAPAPTPEDINQQFLQEQQQRRAELEQQQAQFHGPEAPPTSDLQAAIKNREYLDELQAKRAAQEAQEASRLQEEQKLSSIQSLLQRRQAEMETNVARQTSLDMNAAERARQERGTTGFSEWLSTKQAELAALEEHNNKLKEQQRQLQEHQAIQERLEASRLAQENAQREIIARQREIEFEVKRQRELDFNAQERARQSGADTGYGRWIEGLREDANKRRPGDNTPLQFTQESTLRADLPDNYRYEGAIPGHELMTDIYGAKAVEKQVGIKSAWDKHAIDKLLEDTTLRTKEERAMSREDAGWKLQDEMKDRHVYSRDVGEKTRMMKGGRGPTTTPRLHVRKSQRGGIDFDALSKGLSRVFGKDKSPISNIPGHENTVGAMLTDYAKPEDITSNVMKHSSDVKLINQNYRAGMSNTYAFTNHPLFRQVADLFQTAAKRTDSQIKQFVQPAEHLLIQLQRQSPKEFIQLGKLFMKELSEKKTYAIDDLAKAGFTPRQIGAYQAIRDMFKSAAKRQNEILAEKGLPQMTESEHYLASRRTGDYHQYFYDKQGRLVWMTRDVSKRAANKARNWIHQNVPELDASKTHIEVKSSSGVVEDPAASFASMLLRFGDEPIAQKIKEAQIAQDTASGIRAFQQFQHFKNKAGIRGFEGDKPWLSDKKNAQDLLGQQLQYAKNAFAWSELNKANGVASEVLRNPDILKKFPNAVEHAQNYADRYMGDKGQVFRNLESWFGQKLLGMSGSSVRKGVSAFKQMWTSQKMLTNTGNYAQNLLQPVNTIPFHMMLSDRGYAHDAGRTFALTAADTLGGMAEHYGNKLGIKDPTASMTELGRAATKYAEDNFILDRSPFDEQQSIENTYVPGVTQTAALAKGIDQVTNKSANFAAFMSFVHHLDQSGKFPNRMELFKEAEHWMNASMVDPRKNERPFIVQDTGALGSLAAGLQSYTINKYNSLAGFIDHGVKTGNWKPFGVALGSDMALAGVKGFIPLATYMTIADLINQHSNEDILPDPREALLKLGDSVGDKVDDWFGAKAGQFAKDATKTGIPGAAVGLIPGAKAMDLGPKFSGLPGLPLVGMATDVAQQVGQVATGVSNALGGDSRGLWQVANTLAPVGAAKGAIEALGPFSDKEGPRMDTNVRTLGSTGYKRDSVDTLFKAIGLPSLQENEAKDNAYQLTRLNKIDKTRVQNFSNNIANALILGKAPASGDIQRLFKNYPDVAEAAINGAIQQQVSQWYLDAQTRNMVTANTLSKLERYKEIYGVQQQRTGTN
ncbi:MAG TPA: hypothetical protein VFM18_21395 [Methanosarcina sp.]|nr:hypothetical protein [Methanosarcina sp.]